MFQKGSMELVITDLDCSKRREITVRGSAQISMTEISQVPFFFFFFFYKYFISEHIQDFSWSS